MNRLPVTLVSGFLGAGKTSFLHHVVSEHGGGHLAVLVENPGALNLDAKAMRGLCGAMQRTQDVVLEIPNGDSVMQTEWLGAELRRLAESGRYERVLIELGGLTDAAHLIPYFSPTRGAPKSFALWAELEQSICVVDALEFMSRFPDPSETWSSELQHEQMDGATLLVLNKCDLLEEKDLEVCRKAIQSMHPDGQVVETAYGEVPPGIWAQPASPSLWATILKLQQEPKRTPVRTPSPSLASGLYRVHRPFHPARFWDWFEADHTGLLRVKGIIWLATRHHLVGGVSRTKWQNACGAAGVWWDALPREEWPAAPEALMRMQETWDEPYGDRRQELVLIGDADQVSIELRRQLDACLLTEHEFSQAPSAWSHLPDPFPAWDLVEG